MLRRDKHGETIPDAQTNVPGSPRATVAICTRNRQESLLRCLASLRKQQADFIWEILIVDNGSTDGTHEVIAHAQSVSDVVIRTVVEQKTGLTHARNRALSDARGDVVVMSDDDMTFDEGWLCSHVSSFTDHSTGVTGGRTLPEFPDATPDWLRSVMQSAVGGPCGYYDLGPAQVELVSGDPRLPMGGNMAMRRSCALELGGFSTALGIGNSPLLGEDTDMAMRIRSAGRRILYLPGATTHHHLEPDKLSMSAIAMYFRALGRTDAFMRKSSGKWSMQWYIRNCVKYFVALAQVKVKKNPAKRLQHRIRTFKCQGRLGIKSGKHQ